MPIQIIMSDGLISKDEAKKLHTEISQLLLDVHQISDNRFMIPNVVGEVVFIDQELTFSGKQVTPLAIVELKVPAFTFGTQEQKNLFVQEATEIVFKNCGGKLSKKSIWVNAVYAVDGLWGIEGKAYSNEELAQAVQKAAS